MVLYFDSLCFIYIYIMSSLSRSLNAYSCLILVSYNMLISQLLLSGIVGFIV